MAGVLVVPGVVGPRVPLSNLTAIVGPTVNDDSSRGYSPGSLWINTGGDEAYICTHNGLGAAVWIPLGGGGVSPAFGILTANGAAVGSVDTPFFGVGIPLLAASTYLISFDCYYSKINPGSTTWTFSYTNAPLTQNIHWVLPPSGGIKVPGAAAYVMGGVLDDTSLAYTFTTGSKADGSTQDDRLNVCVQTNLATTLTLNISTSAGTLIPGIGSYYKADKAA